MSNSQGVALPPIPTGLTPDGLVAQINDRLRRITTANSGSSSVSSTTNIVTTTAATAVASVPTNRAYAGALSRSLGDALGDFPSLLDFGNPGSGDAAPFIQSAIAAIAAMGRGALLIPGGTYSIQSPVKITQANVKIYCEPGATKFVRGGTMPASTGVFDVQASGFELYDATIDGAVTTAVGVDYSTVSDPMAAALSTNTSVWIHSGVSNVKLVRCTVQHTGGYAVVVDARTGNVSNVTLDSCLFQNNRPNLFGTGSDLNYGSWTGGVLYVNDGTSYSVSNLLCKSCAWLANTGNCFWGHGYSTSKLNSNVRVIGCHFQDCGLDGTQIANTKGGVITGCTFRRVGYIVSTDGGASTPKWYNPSSGVSIPAVAIDHAGVVLNVAISDCAGISINGGAYDLDGFGTGCSITGGGFRQPVSGDPEYTEDSIASCGPALLIGQLWEYALNFGNTDNTQWGAEGVVIAGVNFDNFGGGVRLNAARNCVMAGCRINHPATGQYPPVSLDNIGAGAYQRAYGNTITRNVITWSPTTPTACIQEYPLDSPFVSGDANLVFANTVNTTTGAYEFSKDPNTGSSTGHVYSSVNALYQNNRSESIVQREGTLTAGLLHWYADTGSGGKSVMSLADYGVAGSANMSPLLNVSYQGTAGTGVVTTGNRASATIQDLIGTGTLYSDGLIALTNTTYADATAQLFGPAFLLLRFYGGALQFSVNSGSTSPYTLNWTNLGTAASPVNSVQFNNSGGFGGSANFTWNNTSQVLTVAGVAGTAAINVTAGYVQTAGGFYTTATAYNAINAPDGGMSAQLFDALVTPNPTSSIYPLFQLDANATAKSRLARYDGGPNAHLSVNTRWGGTSGWLIDDTSQYAFDFYFGNTSLTALTNQVLSLTVFPGNYPTGAATVPWSMLLNGNMGIGVAPGTAAGQYLALGGVSGVAALTINTGSIYLGDTPYNTINIPNGGIYANNGAFKQYMQLTAGSTAPSVAQGSNGAFAYYSGSYYYWNGTAWATWNPGASGGASPGGANTDVQFNNSGAFGGSANLVWNNSSQVLTVTGVAATAAVNVPTGYVQCAGGFFVNDTSGSNVYNAVHVAYGGIAAGAGTNGGFYVGTGQVINTSGVFVSSGGVNVGTAGVSCGGYSVDISGTVYTGQTLTGDTVVLNKTSGGTLTANLKGGILC